jgi:tellurite resistance protein TerC
MGVATWVWVLTLVVTVGVLLLDLFVIGRRPHEPSTRESTLWVLLYIGLAMLFGVGVWYVAGPTYAGQFYAGWLTEYSLSVDNLFVFVIIMSRFAVPRQFQQKTLLIGIVLALVMRGIFIAAGAALISRFVWVFYIFGVFLLITAVRLVTHAGTEDPSEFKENVLIRVARRVLRTSREYDSKAHFTILSRTAKSVKVEIRGEVVTRRVSEYCGIEQFKPFGNYSMCAIVGADDIAA